MKKELKSGYTTGTCAATAAYVALNLLLEKNIGEKVEITTLNGVTLDIPIYSKKKGRSWARAVVLKDAGDDPDVTNGIKVCAKVTIVKKLPEIVKGHKFENLLIVGGRGVGLVTKKGLKVDPGKSAINPGPQEMIVNLLNPILKRYNLKVVVTIYAPKGKEKALKTLNKKLGIVNGISILGSTGIVKPMSEEALTKSMFVELKVLKENTKKDWVIFAFGNHGKQFCIDNEINIEHLIITSNYIGFMIDSALELGFKKVMLIGHIGKAIKVAGGIFNTHSKVADARLEIMAANAILIDEPRENILKILESNTAEEAADYVSKKSELFNLIANKVVNKSYEYSKENIEFQSVLFDYKGNILGYSDKFYEMVEELKSE
ncbi:cobalt-precorrin-5B (C(1))-methyltransferase CbiD [Candidatus Cetobacterium colombiensis]|uniref:Cobalt-precorrin-5B C(1)-methyltransferase n=1 Tax=Candidatus Cetobacterium colombiensis TaxID=3073100 RepID=A0ABU4W9P5_9FUSO|nr:cobalt-precorrin-5B (C(1))-methyltransferase CbiD [Candidatus Cetobacterium colombiensis]MDX8335140.1 cobalt-precorrin-5B (C(1))-methyltransferase CbiD [Candidatus Cetobacterium colombiensis]